MTIEYTTEDLLPLSGIQHFLFCRRQWALIHIEQQWLENALPIETPSSPVPWVFFPIAPCIGSVD